MEPFFTCFFTFIVCLISQNAEEVTAMDNGNFDGNFFHYKMGNFFENKLPDEI